MGNSVNILNLRERKSLSRQSRVPSIRNMLLLRLSLARFPKASFSSIHFFKPQVCSIFANSLHLGNALPHISASCSSSSSTDHKSLGCSASGDDSDKSVDSFKVLKEDIEALGIKCEAVRPGFYDHLMCPKCNGGKLMERTLSFHISKLRDFSMWRCFRDECGWTGQAFVDSQSNPRPNWASNFHSLDVRGLGLEPLGEKLIAYFAERMISKETLERNGVMQVRGDQNIIAFCYKQNGVLVGCKYRRMTKRFWQEKGTQRVFYGLDDIQGVSEIIIVEGELDKLSMEEAGFLNCVSVPGGAPLKASHKELPSVQEDSAYRYVWNCKDYMDKASRIILATDSDVPGQALAEELARRLGKERCWRVFWPRREGSDCLKDTNEVLMNLGPHAVRKAIESAVSFDVQS
ncbi:hypothetical protein V2J09_004735 [Rumex salicifolius]